METTFLTYFETYLTYSEFECQKNSIKSNFVELLKNYKYLHVCC